MILYFTDRSIKVMGLATSDGGNGLTIADDTITESIVDGIKVLNATVMYNSDMYEQAVGWIKPTNYILCQANEEQLFFTITETELDIKNRIIYIYAEDGGLDMINDVAGITSFGSHNLEYYVDYYISGSGFEIGNLDTWESSKSLRFESEETVIARLRRIAEAFNTEMSFRFEIDGLNVTHKYIDMQRKRGASNGVQLRMNQEVDNIIIQQDANNIATALYCLGGTPEGSNKPITLEDYTATSTDGDFYTFSGSKLVFSHSALENYERMNWNSDVPGHGNLIKRFSYDTLSQDTLFEKACEELAEIKDVAITYNVEVLDLGDKVVNIGDTIFIVDDKDEIYLEARVIEIERSQSNNNIQLTLGDYIRRDAGISEKVQELAEQFAEQASKVNIAAAKAEEVAEALEYKNSIVYADEEPPIDDKQINDVWFDTSNGNTPYQFDGTEWVEQTWGADAIRIAELFAQVVTATNLTVTGNSNIVGGKIGGFDIDSETISVETADGKKFELDSANQSLSFEIKDRTSSQYMALDKNGIEVRAYPSGGGLILTPAFFELSDGQGHQVGMSPTRLDVLNLYAVNINGKTPAYADDIPYFDSGTNYLRIGDILVQWGLQSVTTGTSASNSVYGGNAAVTFAKKYSASPRVFVTQNAHYSNWRGVSVASISTDGCTVYAYTSQSNQTRTVSWLAIGKA